MHLPLLRRRGPAARRLVALLGVALALHPALARAQEVSAAAQGAEVRSLAFEGAHDFSPAVLQAAIETAATSCASPLFLCPFGLGTDRQRLDLETLRADVLRLRLFYYQHGYRQARVEAATTAVTGGVRVAFRIQEGRPIRIGSLDLAGAESILPRDILDQIHLHPGDAFGTLSYEAARDTLTARLADRGYPHAQVLASYDLPRDSAALARVRFDVVPGALARIDSIRVIGTRRISPVVVKRMLTFGRGDVYRQDEMLKSQRNLFSLEVFRRVEIRPDLDAAADSLVPVTVDVTEGDLHRVRYGAGLNTAEALNAEARWTSRNFYGGARRLELAARISNILAGPLEGIPFMETKSGKYALLNGSLTADFLQPWFFAPTNTFGAGVFAQRQSLPLVFVQTSYGAYFTLNRTLGLGTSASFGYRPELTSLDADDDRIFCVNLTICDQANQAQDIQVLSTPHWLAPLTFSLTRDHSNALFSPTNGSILHLDAEYAARTTGSAFSYWRLVAELSEYRELVPGLVLALRVRPGFAQSLAGPTAGLGLHPQKRFFAGGANSVRGFAQGQLGPRVLTVDAAGVLAKDTSQGGAGCSADQINDGTCRIDGLQPGLFDVHPVGGGSLLEGNVELRFPLGASTLRGAAFMDYGQLWNAPADFRLRGLVWTPGVGVRYFSAIGPIRVDIAYNPQGSESLEVLTTHVGVRVNGQCQVGPAPAGQMVDCGSLFPLRAITWPPESRTSWARFADHLQLHLSIGQAF